MNLKRSAIGIFLMFSLNVISAEEKLYVFYPTTMRPNAVQEKIHASFKGVAITVFGRYIDFNEKIAVDSPHAILTKTPLIKQLGNFEIALKGSHEGTTNETYVLLSLDSAFNTTFIRPETIIGSIDILGRDGMNSFMTQFFPIAPKLKRVTKVEDLLPMLAFNMASAILVEEHFVDYFKKTSNRNFNIAPLPPIKDGIIALAVRNGGKAEKTIAALKNADKSILSLFNIDLWK